MRRLSIAFALAFLASTFAFVAAPAAAKHDNMMMGQRCHRGTHWIPAHRNRGGHWVRGHCGR